MVVLNRCVKWFTFYLAKLKLKVDSSHSKVKVRSNPVRSRVLSISNCMAFDLRAHGNQNGTFPDSFNFSYWRKISPKLTTLMPSLSVILHKVEIAKRRHRIMYVRVPEHYSACLWPEYVSFVAKWAWSSFSISPYTYNWEVTLWPDPRWPV